MAERSGVEELDALLEDAPAVFAELREGARRRVQALEPAVPNFRRRINRGLFTPLAVALVGLFHALCEDAGLERSAALALLDERLQATYRRRLQPPIKGKLLGGALRLPVLRNAILSALEQAREEPGGFVMTQVESDDFMAFDVEHCPLATFFAQHDAAEVGPLVCKIDDMLADTLPGITLHRSGTIAKGAARCDFRFRRER